MECKQAAKMGILIHKCYANFSGLYLKFIWKSESVMTWHDSWHVCQVEKCQFVLNHLFFIYGKCTFPCLTLWKPHAIYCTASNFYGNYLYVTWQNVKITFIFSKFNILWPVWRSKTFIFCLYKLSRQAILESF